MKSKHAIIAKLANSGITVSGGKVKQSDLGVAVTTLADWDDEQYQEVLDEADSERSRCEVCGCDDSVMDGVCESCGKEFWNELPAVAASSDDEDDERDSNHKYKVGDEVIYHLNDGNEKQAKIIGLGMKNGEELYDLNDGHWAYEDQIVREA
jgi:hypothetical protein